MNSSQSKLKIDPLSVFPNNTKAARFWFFLCCGLGIFAIIQPVMIVQAMKSRERIIIMDESGTFHVSPLLQFEESAPMHDYLISVATNALLSRGPKGADNPPLQKQVFLDKAYKKILAFYSEDDEHFANKKIHQKAEIKSIKVFKTSEKTVLAQVQGQLIRIGTFESRNFTDTKDFSLQMTLYRNPRMSANGRLPLAVLNWAVKIRDHQIPSVERKEDKGEVK